MTHYYFAARFEDRQLMCDHRNQLEYTLPGRRVVSRWIEPGSVDFTTEQLQQDPETVWQAVGERDCADLELCDTVVSFTFPEGGGRGGRHVEFGVGLALGKRMVLVGPRQHVFHTSPQVEQYDTFTDFLEFELQVGDSSGPSW